MWRYSKGFTCLLLVLQPADATTGVQRIDAKHKVKSSQNSFGSKFSILARLSNFNSCESVTKNLTAKQRD